MTLATDDGVEVELEDEELEVDDDVEELDDEEVELAVAELVLVFELLDEFDGGRLELEEELDNVITPHALIAITRTNPIRNHNQKGFLLFLSFSFSSSL